MLFDSGTPTWNTLKFQIISIREEALGGGVRRNSVSECVLCFFNLQFLHEAKKDTHPEVLSKQPQIQKQNGVLKQKVVNGFRCSVVKSLKDGCWHRHLVAQSGRESMWPALPMPASSGCWIQRLQRSTMPRSYKCSDPVSICLISLDSQFSRKKTSVCTTCSEGK